MGHCDPKEIRKGKPWHVQVNEPGFITQAMKDHHARTHGHLQGRSCGTAPNPTSERDNYLSVNNTQE